MLDLRQKLGEGSHIQKVLRGSAPKNLVEFLMHHFTNQTQCSRRRWSITLRVEMELARINAVSPWPINFVR